VKKLSVSTFIATLALATGLAGRASATGAGKAAPAAAPGGAMQVEEPASGEVPPINPERESLSWQGKLANHGLTQQQRNAMRERQERMKELIAALKEKREAMQGATEDEKAELARQLRSFMLDKEEGDADEPPERVRQMQQDRRARQAELQAEKMHLLQEKLQEKAQERSQNAGGNGKDNSQEH
jgi:hypothetical protein